MSLYSTRAQRPLSEANALPVLAAAIFLDLHGPSRCCVDIADRADLSYRAWVILSAMIQRLSSPADILHWIDYLSTPDVANPSAPPSGTIADESTAMGALWTQLLTHLVTGLPAMLGAFGPGGDSTALVAVYAQIPFDRFKTCVEDPRLTTSNMERVRAVIVGMCAALSRTTRRRFLRDRGICADACSGRLRPQMHRRTQATSPGRRRGVRRVGRARNFGRRIGRPGRAVAQTAAPVEGVELRRALRAPPISSRTADAVTALVCVSSRSA